MSDTSKPDKILVVPADPAAMLSEAESLRLKQQMDDFLAGDDIWRVSSFCVAIYQRIDGVWRYCGPNPPVKAGEGVQLRLQQDGSLLAVRTEEPFREWTWGDTSTLSNLTPEQIGEAISANWIRESKRYLPDLTDRAEKPCETCGGAMMVPYRDAGFTMCQACGDQKPFVKRNTEPAADAPSSMTATCDDGTPVIGTEFRALVSNSRRDFPVILRCVVCGNVPCWTCTCNKQTGTADDAPTAETWRDRPPLL